jgi:hypothetical protein
MTTQEILNMNESELIKYAKKRNNIRGTKYKIEKIKRQKEIKKNTEKQKFNILLNADFLMTNNEITISSIETKLEKAKNDLEFLAEQRKIFTKNVQKRRKTFDDLIKVKKMIRNQLKRELKRMKENKPQFLFKKS